VTVSLEEEFTPHMVERGETDVVMIAAGADPTIPEKIPGLDGPKVVSVDEVMNAQAEVGDRVVIWTCSHYCRYTCKPKVAPVDGDPTHVESKRTFACLAGYGAVDTAEYLASLGKLVSIVTERNAVVPGMGFTSRGYLLKRFYRANIRVCDSVKVKEITEQGLVLEKAGVTFLLDADTVIISVGGRPRRGLGKALEGKVAEVYSIGDGDMVGNAMKAIESAYDTAMKI
jgi:2,4-dienoyl-CoA reductase (NADPH2)